MDYCAVFLLSAGDFYTRAFFFTPKHAENVLWFFTKKNRGKKTAQKQHMLLQKKSFLGHFYILIKLQCPRCHGQETCPVHPHGCKSKVDTQKSSKNATLFSGTFFPFGVSPDLTWLLPIFSPNTHRGCLIILI